MKSDDRVLLLPASMNGNVEANQMVDLLKLFAVPL